ncbi:YetF domain-containing protein [Nocardioides sp.]|uniref:DUF421 domain-containing protein n=1 Tax=Nocardioides sp. TaxID=35761 RepID=UPI0019BA80EA|nr:YetF domain-containing protein [Nocardioides sp.]MBC7278826.1 DUF421 domain-containing protein [Nocardioides sp.]
MWFDTWHDLLRIVVVGASGYATLVLLLRLSGKRTLAKLNAFDFVVTVALGSTLATILLDSRTAWADGVVALATLVVLQLVVAALTAWTRSGRRLLTAGPSVLLRDGVADTAAMRRQRVGMDELRQAVRGTGTGDLSQVAVVVLETDGTMSVIPRSQAGDLSSLGGLDGHAS